MPCLQQERDFCMNRQMEHTQIYTDLEKKKMAPKQDTGNRHKPSAVCHFIVFAMSPFIRSCLPSVRMNSILCCVFLSLQ